jgi:hypothetical protein
MHQTTIRSSIDARERIDQEAGRAGISAAQFVREAAIARLTQLSPQLERRAVGGSPSARTSAARSDSLETRQGSAGVWAQARLARRRAQEVREEARGLHGRGVAGSA